VAFYPLVSSSDDRSTKGCVPIVLRNVMAEPQPIGSGKRTKFFIAPTMGRTARVTPSSGQLVRGVFSRPGVQDGALFVAAGSQLYVVDADWNATALGPIQGSSGTVLFDSVGAKLTLMAGGSIYEYDSASGLQINTDPDCPLNAYNLVSLGERVLTNQEGSETFDWSSVSTALDWPSTGFASSARLPDEIRSQIVIAGEAWHFGANSTQIWRAMGGEDSEAFDILNVVIDRGIIGRDAIAKLDSSVMWVGDNRVVYMLNGYTPMRVSNREIEQALAALTEEDAALLQCFAYAQGSHLTWMLRMPSGKAFAYDTMTQSWSERTTWGAARYQPAYYAYFNGKHVVASDEDDTVWSWDEDVYDDDGDPIERIITVHVPVAARTIISSLCLDIKCTDAPIDREPYATVTFYTDGGNRDSLAERNVERRVSLGKRGAFSRRPIVYSLGMVNAADGMVIKIRITDPVNFVFSGVWVNEDPR